MGRALGFGALGAVLGALLLGGTYALATTSSFLLGSTTANKPDALTAVTAQNKDGHGGLNGSMIQLANSSTGSSATPLALNVGAGRPPLVTSSTTRVANLNADLLDGLDSTNLLRGPGQVLRAKLQVSPGDGGLLIDRSGAKPGFTVSVACAGDPSTGGSAGMSPVNPPTMDLVVDRASGVTSYPQGTGISTSIDSGSEATFSAGIGGHVVVVWVFLLTRDGQPDPRDDGCYFQASGFVK